jgi:hypothetical protein
MIRLAKTYCCGGGGGAGGGGGGGAALLAPAGGAVAGSVEPRWHVKQLTCIFPSGNFALISRVITIMLRAISFFGFASLAKSPCT